MNRDADLAWNRINALVAREESQLGSNTSRRQLFEKLRDDMDRRLKETPEDKAEEGAEPTGG